MNVYEIDYTNVSVTEEPIMVKVTEVAEQGPPGPKGPAGSGSGTSTIEAATDLDTTVKVDGSVLEWNETAGEYVTATPIKDRVINGGYF